MPSDLVRTVAFCFCIAEQLPSEFSDLDVINEALSHVFYGMADDGNQLVTISMGLRNFLPERFLAENKIRVFSIYGAENSIPTYEQLTLKRLGSVEEALKK